MWFTVLAIGLIALVLVFILGVMIGVVLELWQIKEEAPDVYRMYKERIMQKEEWTDGAGQGSV